MYRALVRGMTNSVGANSSRSATLTAAAASRLPAPPPLFPLPSHPLLYLPLTRGLRNLREREREREAYMFIGGLTLDIGDYVQPQTTQQDSASTLMLYQDYTRVVSRSSRLRSPHRLSTAIVTLLLRFDCSQLCPHRSDCEPRDDRGHERCRLTATTMTKKPTSTARLRLSFTAWGWGGRGGGGVDALCIAH